MLYKLVTAVKATKLFQAFDHRIFGIVRAIEDHKSTTTGTGDLTPGSASLRGCIINIFHQGITDAFGHQSFLVKADIKDVAYLIQFTFQ